MKRKIKLIVLALVVIGGAFLYAHIDKNIYLYNRDTALENYVQTGVLLEGESISQTFLCPEEVLDGINLKSAVVGNVENIVLKYTITDNETGEVTEGTVKGADIKANKFNPYMFQKIDHAKDRGYTLLLEAKGTDINNGVSFYVDQTENKVGQLTIREQKAEGALVVRLISHKFDMETFIVLLGFVAFITAFIKVLYKLFK